MCTPRSKLRTSTQPDGPFGVRQRVGAARIGAPTSQPAVGPCHTARRDARGGNVVGTNAVKQQAARPKLSQLRGTYVFEGERFELTGKAALILARFAARAQWMNDTVNGRVVADFGHSQVKLELTESLRTIRLDD